jgi:hypothetical protein
VHPTVTSPTRADAELRPQKPAEVPLKPDRLSYLLDKLFDAAKRDVVERHVGTQTAAPESIQSAEPAPLAAYPAESEILDLRGPEPLPDPPEEPEPVAVAPTPLPVEETATVEGPVATIESVAAEPPVETRFAELEAASEPQEAPSSPDAAPAVAAPQLEPSEQPATSKRPRRAEPATHFGSRARPPGGQTPGAGPNSKARRAGPGAEQPAAASEQPPVPGAIRHGARETGPNA